MAHNGSGSLDDYNSWLNVTDGGVRYRFLNMEGEMNFEGASMTWSILIRAIDLNDLCNEVFPNAYTTGNISLPKYFKLQNLQGLVATKLSFKRFIDGMPIDPFGIYSNSPEGTFPNVIQVDVGFLAEKGNSNGNPEDPFTFLDISASTTGEFVIVPATKAKKVIETPSTKEKDKNTGEVENQQDDVDGEGDATIAEQIPEGPQEKITNPSVQVRFMVPMTQWTCKWHRIPYKKFKEVIVKRLRSLLGRTNQAKFELLHDAPRETLILAGFSYQQKNNWQFGREGGELENPPIELEIKFIEKHVYRNGMIMGHNHVWDPDLDGGAGWTKLLVNGKPLYELADFNLLFRTGETRTSE